MLRKHKTLQKQQETSPEIQLPIKKELLPEIQQPGKLVLSPVIQRPENLAPEIRQTEKLVVRPEIQQPANLVLIQPLGNLVQIQEPGNLVQIQPPENLVLIQQPENLEPIQQPENLVQRPEIRQLENLVQRPEIHQPESLVVLRLDNKAQRVEPETINKVLTRPLKAKKEALVRLEGARSPPGKRAKEEKAQNWMIPLKSSSTNLLRTQRRRCLPARSMALAWKGSYAKFWICLLMSVDFVSANAIFRKAAFMLYAINSTIMGCTHWILRTWPICTSVSLLRQRTFCLDACLI
ncbi:PREDICTED: uncharacterized protein LOC108609005 isoform X4 [Drosophila arizonae]|uniref:Uncharacterized protein LOC108609005 isoform X4 n=1 Tax=Drosophila arizonae TaxID=7263 RepID=A0ABM1NMH8_DROAR|nr:PREDICTED: uncharacterized protein LOC108609005 isoform X4 [Drosophila arizonae]